MKKNTFVEPFPFQFDYWIHKNIPIVSNLIVPILFLLPSLVFILNVPSANNTTIAFFGIFTGAIISGVISYLLQQKELHAKSLIDKKEKVYEIIYRELLALKKNTKVNPYPISLNLGAHENWPQCWNFIEWSKIIQDHRYIEVPEWFRLSLDKLYDDLSEYYDRKYKASVACGAKIKEFQSKYPHLGWPTSDQSFPHILSSALLNDKDVFSSMVKNFLQIQNVQASDDSVDQIWNIILSEIPSIQEVKDFNLYYLNMIVEINWLCDKQRKIIELINIKFENQKKYI